MSSFWSSTDSWGNGHGGFRLTVRLISLCLFGYLLLNQGAFTGAGWVAVITGLALLLSLLLGLLRVFRPFDRIALVLTTAMMLCGAVVNPEINFLGSVFFVLGGVMLVGQPDLSVHLSIGLVAAVTVVLLAVVVVMEPRWSILFSNGLAALAVALFGTNRRQLGLRQRQDRELAARSRELEERNAELVAQTEQTRREAARVAALEERGRIARDLHDVLAHSLGGLIVQLDAAEGELSHGVDVAAVAARLQTSRQLAVQGLREARTAVDELRTDLRTEADPGSIEPDSLRPDSIRPDSIRPGSIEPAARRDLTDAVLTLIRGPVGVHLGADLEVIGDPRPVPVDVEVALSAVTREALTNINKHAPRSKVSATLVFAPELISLELVNGLPVDRSEAPRAASDADSEGGGGPANVVSELAATGSGAGLPGLDQRMAAVGGRFAAGQEGRRWVVSATVPESAIMR